MHCMTDPKCHVTYKHLGLRIVKPTLKDPMGDRTRTLGYFVVFVDCENKDPFFLAI